MKGILLAGGSGSRLWPMTVPISKHIVPIFDKPMIYYPLSMFMEAGIEEILIISSPESISLYRKLLRDGSQFGLSLTFQVQEKPNGIAQALIIGEDFLDGLDVCLILGDNLFHGGAITDSIGTAKEDIRVNGGAHLFGTEVPDPERFGVAEVSTEGVVSSIEEKPDMPKSNVAITGLYMYSFDSCSRAKSLTPSKRGELEITDLNMTFVREGRAKVTLLDKETVWLDTGTPIALAKASEYVSSTQEKSGEIIACLEEIAWKNGLIDRIEMLAAVEGYPDNNEYAKYIRGL